MPDNASPIVHIDRQSRKHVEPSISGRIQVQSRESPRSVIVNDVILISTFRSGRPLVLRRFSSMAALRDAHDPDGNGDVGTALAQASRDPFPSDDIFGSRDILTVRVDTATAASSIIKAGGGATDMIKVTRNDYGTHTNNTTRELVAGTSGKKITLVDLNDTRRSFEKDNLGPLFSLRYTGDAGSATLSIRTDSGAIAYTGNPSDGDTFSLNGVIFEFDNDSNVAGGNVAAPIGATAAVTFEQLEGLIEANVPGVSASHDTGASTLNFGAPEEGVLLEEVVDAGGVFGVSQSGSSVYMEVALDGAQTDGSQDLSLPLVTNSYKTIGLLVAFLNSQNGYEASLAPAVNPFLISKSIDAVVGADITTDPGPTITGYAAVIADWINSSTQGQYTAEILERGLEPDEDTAPVKFTGGSTPIAVTAQDYLEALEVVGAELERGGIIILDTQDEAIFAMVVAFIEEQQGKGKWFRAFLGSKPYDELGTQLKRSEKFGQIAFSLDSTRCRLYSQRMGQFVEGGGIEYLPSTYLAAAMAGGAAGNQPYVNPLTNKAIRFIDIDERDRFTEEVRAALLQTGVTVVRREGTRRVVTLAVTTSQDPSRRMNRIMSERDVVDLIEANVREAFLPFRGKWANISLAATVNGLLSQVLNRFEQEGAISQGEAEDGTIVPAWRGIAIGPNGENWVLQEGLLKIDFQVFVPGELDHIDFFGRADYQRLAGSVSGSAVEVSTTII